MNALLKRIEKLEEVSRPRAQPDHLRIIRVVVDPEAGATSALCEGQQINRHAGEAEADFRERYCREFNRAFSSPCVESVDGDEEI